MIKMFSLFISSNGFILTSRYSIRSSLNNFSYLSKQFAPKVIRFTQRSRRPFLSQTSFATDVSAPTVVVPPRFVGLWLGGCAGMCFTAVILGGLTRLTESGLSMVDWKLFGRKLPVNAQEWNDEFDKYKTTPEFVFKNAEITLEEFKLIWYMEYGHRMWGRLIGAFYYIPAGIMWAKGYFSLALKKRVVFGGILLAFQGLLGWYMVKSGLDHANFEGPNDTPRVSQYRLASHLTAAMVLYSVLFWNSLSVLIPPVEPKCLMPAMKNLRIMAIPSKTLIFFTAVSGAFVAGLDAGLTYNTFPLMAGCVIPSDVLALSPVWKNFTENSTTVQFDHRILGTATLAIVTYMAWRARPLFAYLSPRSKKAMITLLSLTWIQVGLGISTLLLYVPTCVAVLHQAGALSTLSAALWLSHELQPIKSMLKRLPK